jgi:hypothetical protein
MKLRLSSVGLDGGDNEIAIDDTFRALDSQTDTDEASARLTRMTKLLDELELVNADRAAQQLAIGRLRWEIEAARRALKISKS